MKPYRINERRSSHGYTRTNTLFEAATQSTQRKRVSELDKDAHELVSLMGRKLLMYMGRTLYANLPAVAGIVDEQADIISANLFPQFDGEDTEWGDNALEQLRLFHQIMCLEGRPYNRQTFLKLAVIAIIRDGDFGYLLTESPNRYPLVQTIPSHRIESSNATTVSDEQSRWRGRTITDGVITDDYRRALAYRVYDQGKLNFKDIAANSLSVPFNPTWQDQLRGFSRLATGAFNMMDLKESRDFELIAQKASSALALIEENEMGAFDPSQGILNTAATFASTGAQSTLTQELMSGGEIRYVKAGKGKITAHHFDRPGANTQNYQDTALRDVCMSLGWSYWFSVDPTKPGSGPFRVIVDKINRYVKGWRQTLALMALHIDTYAIARMMDPEVGILPFNEEWYKWKYPATKDISADKKYDSDVDVQEVAADINTLEDACARRNMYWEDVQDANIRAKFRKVQKAKELAKEYGLTPEEAEKAMGTQESKNDMQEDGTKPNRTRREPQVGGEGKDAEDEKADK